MGVPLSHWGPLKQLGPFELLDALLDTQKVKYIKNFFLNSSKCTIVQNVWYYDSVWHTRTHGGGPGFSEIRGARNLSPRPCIDVTLDE